MSKGSDLADKLVNGQTYSARKYRARDAENPPAFAPMDLFVQHHKGKAVTVSPASLDWAEFDPRQEAWIEGGVLQMMAEDYYLEIEISSIEG
jgi:hypothetical protein